jgi:hypothetical protein
MTQTRYWYDTEFMELGPAAPIEFISIGIVCEDGREYYAVNKEAPWSDIHKHTWLETNVVPHLPPASTWKTRAEIKQEIIDFFRKGDNPPSLHAWFASYDHVVLAQIFGVMMDFPLFIPMYTHDVRSFVDWHGIDPRILPKQKTGNHDALEDARHLKKVHTFIEERQKLLINDGGSQ